jgi:hypothetical protein
LGICLSIYQQTDCRITIIEADNGRRFYYAKDLHRRNVSARFISRKKREEEKGKRMKKRKKKKCRRAREKKKRIARE